MKYKISTFLLLGITIILCFTYLRQKQEISKLNNLSIIGKTDTIYSSGTFKPVKEYSTQILPKYVFLYGSFSDDSNSDLAIYNNNPNQEEDSLIQMLLSKDDLKLAFKSSGGFLTNDFDLDLDRYQYNWVDGKLTQKKLGFKIKLEPYLYAKYRYFNKMADLGFGISFKTQNLSYKLGLNGFYYPCLQNKLGTDLEFTITYNLSK